MTQPDQETLRSTLAAGFQRSGLSLEELWLAYLAIGGTGPPEQILAQLQGDHPITPVQYDLLAQSINDQLNGQPGAPRLPSFEQLH
jgi:hypothetical protein